MVTPINTMEFATVVSKKITELDRGQTVMVMGDRTYPASNTDPYLFRKLVVVAKVNENGVEVPSDSNDYRGYLVDPRHLQRFPDDLQESMTDKFINSRVQAQQEDSG